MFQKGHKKIGGRKKGGIDKNKQELVARINSLYPNYCPIEAMIRIAIESNDVYMRLAACKEVAHYMYPKLKSVDHNHGGQDGNSMNMNLQVKFI